MTSNPPPQWLAPAFARSALAIGATAPREELLATAEELLCSWQSAGRAYHGIRHLVEVLAAIDMLAEETRDPDAVRIAAWYHGVEFSADRRVLYAHRGGEDPLAGSRRAEAELSALGVPPDAVAHISAMVVQADRHAPRSDDSDAKVLIDADLATLGAEPQRYAAYRRSIRQEYAHVEDEEYLETRIAILRKLMARGRIFVSPMGQQWEEAARENISAELEMLTAELEEIEESGGSSLESTGEGAHLLQTAQPPADALPPRPDGLPPASSVLVSEPGAEHPPSASATAPDATAPDEPAQEPDAERDPDLGSPPTPEPPSQAHPRSSRLKRASRRDLLEEIHQLSPGTLEEDDTASTLTRIPRYPGRP